MTDHAERSGSQLAGKGKFYDPQGRFVDDCQYSLEVTTLEADAVGRDGVPEFVTVRIAGTITDTEQLIPYFGLRMPLTLELDDSRRIRFRMEDMNSIRGYGFYPTRISDPEGAS